jgi:nicotinamidase-related amidase
VSSHVALVIIDLINPFDFPGADRLLPRALPAARRTASIAEGFRQRGDLVIYANDNFADWHADFRQLVAIATAAEARGREVADVVRPAPQDYFILKPKHSAFLGSPLDLLLRQRGIERLVLTGIAADACVLATAVDAAMRDYQVHIPADAVAAQDAAREQAALATLRDGFALDTSPWRDLPG